MLDRRNFLGNLIIAGAVFTILPGAGRIWRAERRIVNPDWKDEPLEISYVWLPNHTMHLEVRSKGYKIWENIIKKYPERHF